MQLLTNHLNEAHSNLALRIATRALVDCEGGCATAELRPGFMFDRDTTTRAPDGLLREPRPCRRLEQLRRSRPSVRRAGGDGHESLGGTTRETQALFVQRPRRRKRH